MSIKKYQDEIDQWLKGFEKPYWAPLSQLARMVEEIGELSRILNHKYGDKVKKETEKPDDIEDELGDILFTVICLANSEGINLDEALNKVINKSKTRDADRFDKKKLNT